MLDNMQNGFALSFGILGAVLVAAGAVTFAGWIVFDLANLEGLLAYSLVMLAAGALIFSIALSMGDLRQRND